jgi:Leucine-rich repeat (LRR) protein
VDIAILSQFTGLVKLNVSKNKIKSIAAFSSEEAFLNLKWLDVSNNKFSELVGLKCPKLEYLDIGYNKLEKVNETWAGHPTVKVLKSVDNKFKNLQILKDFPKLEELYLEANVIQSIQGYETLPKLRILHLRRNKIEKFEDELPPHESLTSINLRGNKVPSLD